MAGELKPQADAGAPTPAEWRAAMGYFPTGVTIVTSWQGDEPVGSTVNAFCSVSLEPPMLLVCLDRINPLRRPVERSGVFGVNMLGEDGHGTALRFAKPPETARFRDFAFRSAPGGAPQLRISPAFVDCALEAVHAAGDHYIMIGRGIRTFHSPGVTPLLYHRGQFPKFPPPE